MSGQATDADVVVIGGGPVGLHAALKAAVLRRRVILFDKGRRFSRIVQAAAIANIPGHPGISGEALLERGREDLRAFERLCGKSLVDVREETEVVALDRADGGFRASFRGANGRGEELVCGAVILATGIVDRKPDIERYYWQGQHAVSPWLHRGRIAYCLLCEGWEAEYKRIAVVGSGESAVEVARSLARHFDADVMLLTQGEPLEQADELRRGGVTIDERSVAKIDEADGVALRLDDGVTERFDKAFFMLGWYTVNNELAVKLGAATTADGFVKTDEQSEVLDAAGKRIPGLFAVGDLRADRWKQIVVGWGDAETAVIAAHANRLPD